ncbi:uncharacterized protein LOC129721024 [Wyeomyia smithii]|uniref:uncharacterized protein LOC129721024 n=1 Tax=Wyeomyia smithii TaxID=174621 RepID=UPI002467DD2E|nr:uncharacterized protein LOC129721024 [Wyeomyia smithii]
MLAFILGLLILHSGWSSEQTISLRNLTNQPILAFDHGTSRVRIDSYFYIHHFNISSYQYHVRNLRDMFDEIATNQFSILIIEEFKQIDQILNNLISIKRSKRWDSLGWKFIAGSPVANDLKIINSSINNLIQNNNAQVKINRELNLQMKEFVRKTTQAISLFNTKSIENHSINIFLNLKYLHEKLEQIVDSISLAKIGILNSKILSTGEIQVLVRRLHDENVTTNSISEALSYAESSVATNSKEVALLIKIPKLDKRIFRKIHIYPIRHKQRQIYLERQNYLKHHKEIYAVPSLNPTIFNIEDLIPENSTCISELLNGKPASCNFTLNLIQEEIITVNDKNLIINYDRNFSLTSNCGIFKRNLFGPFFISFENCNVSIDNNTFSSNIHNLEESPLQIPLEGISVEQGHLIVNLSLEHLHELHLETRKELENIKLQTNSFHWPKLTIFGGITFPLTIIISIVLCQ